MHHDIAGIALHGTGEEFDQRRFAGAVLAEKGVDFAGPQVEVDAAKGLNRSKTLFDPAQFDERHLLIGGGGGDHVWLGHGNGTEIRRLRA